MQDAPKAMWSIPYVSVAFFQVYNRILLRIVLPHLLIVFFYIHQLWKSGFNRVYSNSFCSCFFESETIKIGESLHKMYGSNMLSFQESTTILNICTKKVWEPIEFTT